MLFFESTLGKYRRTREYEIKIETALNFPLGHEYLSQGNPQFLKSLHIEHMSNGEYLYQQGCIRLRQLEDVSTLLSHV